MGIRDDLNEIKETFIDILSAIELLAKIEGVSAVDAAVWLVEKNAHRKLRPFLKKGGIKVSNVEQLRRLAVENIAMMVYRMQQGVHDYDATQARNWVDKIRWRRDDFWQWVQEQGVEIRAEFFKNPLDCPAYLQRSATSGTAKEKVNLPHSKIDTSPQATLNLKQKRATTNAQNDEHPAKLIEVKNTGTPVKATIGLTITLPHTTKTLNALFEVMCANWTSYDERYPPKSTIIAAELDKKMGWQSQRDGGPSRSAQTLAAAIRPDNLSEADLRNQKRRSRKSRSDGTS